MTHVRVYADTGTVCGIGNGLQNRLIPEAVHLDLVHFHGDQFLRCGTCIFRRIYPVLAWGATGGRIPPRLLPNPLSPRTPF
jgi:hypothetical protein